MNEDILDLNDVMNRIQDDKELLMELLDIFQEDYLEKEKLIHAAIGNRNAGALKDIAHALKGASGNISARSLQASFSQMEKSAEANDLDDIRRLMPQVEKQFKELQAVIAQMKARGI